MRPFGEGASIKFHQRQLVVEFYLFAHFSFHLREPAHNLDLKVRFSLRFGQLIIYELER